MHSRPTKAEKQARSDYRDRLWQSTPHPKLFPLPRLAVTLLLSGGQFCFGVLRHRWNPRSPIQVGREVIIFSAVTIIIYMVIYALEWSWNYVVLSPMIIDNLNQTKLKQNADEIASLNEKLASSSQGQKEIKRRLAALMEREVEIRERLERVNNDPELAELVAESEDWVRQTILALKDSGELTDAVAFSQVGKLPQSAEQAQEWRHIPDEPRRRQLIRLAMYCKKLNQIMDNRRL